MCGDGDGCFAGGETPRNGFSSTTMKRNKNRPLVGGGGGGISTSNVGKRELRKKLFEANLTGVSE